MASTSMMIRGSTGACSPSTFCERLFYTLRDCCRWKLERSVHHYPAVACLPTSTSTPSTSFNNHIPDTPQVSSLVGPPLWSAYASGEAIFQCVSSFTTFPKSLLISDDTATANPWNASHSKHIHSHEMLHDRQEQTHPQLLYTEHGQLKLPASHGGISLDFNRSYFYQYNMAHDEIGIYFAEPVVGADQDEVLSKQSGADHYASVWRTGSFFHTVRFADSAETLDGMSNEYFESAPAPNTSSTQKDKSRLRWPLSSQNNEKYGSIDDKKDSHHDLSHYSCVARAVQTRHRCAPDVYVCDFQVLDAKMHRLQISYYVTGPGKHYTSVTQLIAVE